MKIMSFDGGGIRGIIPARIVERLVTSLPYILGDVDMFAGTSTGSYIAAYFAAELPPESLVFSYKSMGRNIFKSRDWKDIVAGPLDEYVRADYGVEGLISLLKSTFGDLTLGDLKKHVIIPTIYLGDSSRPASVKVFHNFDTPGNDQHIRIADACLASAAAPVYFPSYGGFDTRLPLQFVDGGLALNNPSAAALSKCKKSGVSLDDIHMLSFSCGNEPLVIEGGDWGARQWVIKGAPLLKLLFAVQVGCAHYECSEFLDGRYCRVDPVLDTPLGLDDIGAIPEMLELSDRYDIQSVETWLRQGWRDGK